MPVLRHDDQPNWRETASIPLDDRIALRHGERAAGTEVVLRIDDDQGVIRLRGKGHARRAAQSGRAANGPGQQSPPQREAKQ